MNAAVKLINKVIPDRKAVEHTGEGGGPIETHMTLDASKLSSSALEELLDAATDKG